MQDPAKTAGEEAKRLHRLAFPESYEEKPEIPPEGETKPDDDTSAETPSGLDSGSVHDEETYHARYDTLLGKYNAEVPRLHERVRQLTDENTVLKSQIAELKEARVETQQERDEEGNILYRSPYVTDEMRSTDNYKYLLGEYGQTYAERHIETSVLAARSTVKPVEERMETVTAATAEEQFNIELGRICPSWQGLKVGINVDPEFIAWTQGKIAGARNRIIDDLSEAYYSADAVRMTEIINLFLAQKPKPPSTGKQTIPNELIVPGKSGGGSQVALDNAGGNVLRMSDMNQLYKDYQDGKYRYKEAEYQKKKAEFMKAKTEGRLIP